VDFVKKYFQLIQLIIIDLQKNMFKNMKNNLHIIFADEKIAVILRPNDKCWFRHLSFKEIKF
jgi:hypothetical protein